MLIPFEPLMLVKECVDSNYLLFIGLEELYVSETKILDGNVDAIDIVKIVFIIPTMDAFSPNQAQLAIFSELLGKVSHCQHKVELKLNGFVSQVYAIWS